MEKYTFFGDINDDRIYFPEDFARHLAKYFTNGIFNNGCMILADTNDMSVNVSTGSANINGYRYDNDSSKLLTIENADGVLNRIDNIVIRWDLTNRTITAQVIKGSFAENPVAPNLVRTSTIYDLRIAKVSIPAGTTTITQDLVEDTRFLNSDCGNVVCAVETPDTEELYSQLYARAEKLINDSKTELEDFIKESKKNFENWFANVQDILDGNTAGNLLNKINSLEQRAVTDSDYVHTDNNFSDNYKQQLDNLDIPDSTSDLTNDSNFGRFIQAESEEQALTLSTANPDNFYYYVEE